MKRILLLLVAMAMIGTAAWLLARRPVGTHSVSGTVEVDDVHVASRYGGRVEKLHAQEGDALCAGQLLVELDAAELRARHDYRVAVLEELERGPRPAEIASAQATWESLVAQIASTRADAERARQLFAQHTISESEMQNVASRADALEKNAAAAKSRYALLAEGTRPERLAQARAQLAETDAQLREMRVVASGDCVLETLNVKVGDVVPPNREVATLLLPQHLWVRVYVPEPWLGGIQIGQSVAVRADFPRGKEFTGVVEQIHRQAEFTPRNVQTVEERIRQVFGVKVRLPGDSSALRAGMSVDVFFPQVPPAPK